MDIYSIITRMIPRRIEPIIHDYLQQFPAVALLGPRQVGKTTLATHPKISFGFKPDYLDLEKPDHLEKLQDPVQYLKRFDDRLVIIDEIQRAPGLFQILRGIIDERIFADNQSGNFLLLGSASLELLRQSSETLAGRIAYIELNPLDVLEIEPGQEEILWVRGGFPRCFLAESEKKSITWRNNFITSYLERDIGQFGPRIPAETMRRFWTMLAHNQGGILNAAQLAGSLAIDGKTVAKYLDIMVDLLMVRRLPPYYTNIGKRLVKSPKIYVRDSGIVHALLRIDNIDQLLGHPIAGMSWEGHVIETLINVAPEQTQASFYRTSAGAEIDLILELPGNQTWAIEIKRSLVPKISKGFLIALGDLKPNKAFIVYSGQERYPKSQNIEAISVRELAQQLVNLA